MTPEDRERLRAIVEGECKLYPSTTISAIRPSAVLALLDDVNAYEQAMSAAIATSLKLSGRISQLRSALLEACALVTAATDEVYASHPPLASRVCRERYDAIARLRAIAGGNGAGHIRVMLKLTSGLVERCKLPAGIDDQIEATRRDAVVDCELCLKLSTPGRSATPPNDERSQEE